MMKGLYETTSLECSKIVTTRYSTSFTLGIKVLGKRYHYPIYAIYGFVRYADEIVDTFHHAPKKELLNSFRLETYKAIDQKISLNPILHSFQLIVNQYAIPFELIEAFFESMEMDLVKYTYNSENFRTYIYGSAEVVGLMCLKVFCENNNTLYEELAPAAKSLGAAFQKVNFLRDLQDDYLHRGRVYFPKLKMDELSEKDKMAIVSEIEIDFKDALSGIKKLPTGVRPGVYLAYVYYLTLLKKIKNSSVTAILSNRIRIPNPQKLWLLLHSYLKFRLNML